jgi:predicted RNA-binding protein Jag
VAASPDRDARHGAPRGDERRGPERQGERRAEGGRPFERRGGERRRPEGAPGQGGGRGDRSDERRTDQPRRENLAPREDLPRRETLAPREDLPRRDDMPRRDDVRQAPMSGVPALSSGVPGAEGGDEPRRRRRRGRRGGRGRGGNRAEMPAAFEPASDGEELRTIHEHEAPLGRAMDAAFATPPMSAAPMSAAPVEPPVAFVPPMESAPMEDSPVYAHAAPQREFGDRGERRPFRERDGNRREEPHRKSESPALSSDALAGEAIRCTQELLRAMGFEGKVTATASEDRVDVVAEVGSDDEMLNGAKGEVRQALQHLLNRMVNRGEGSRYHLQLEINDFWKRREEELHELARQLADRAVANQAEALTEYLNAQERRIIHVALREDSRVKTYALGDGMIKRLAVAPADFPEGGRDE